MFNATRFCCSLVALLILYSLVCEAFIPRMIQGRPKGGMVRGPIKKNVFNNYTSEDLWFIQKLDHFTPSDTRTWKQVIFLFLFIFYQFYFIKIEKLAAGRKKK